MKGLLLWTFILTVLTVIGLTFLLGFVILSKSRALETSAALNAEEISGVINLLQAAQPGTVHQYTLPQTECEIKIDDISVTVSMKAGRKGTHSLGYIKQQSIDVVDGTETCDPKKDKIIYLVRCKNTVAMSQSTKPC